MKRLAAAILLAALLLCAGSGALAQGTAPAGRASSTQYGLVKAGTGISATGGVFSVEDWPLFESLSEAISVSGGENAQINGNLNVAGGIGSSGAVYAAQGQFTPAFDQDGIIVNAPDGYSGAALHLLDSSGGNLMAIGLDGGIYPDISAEYGQVWMFGGGIQFLANGELYMEGSVNASGETLAGASAAATPLEVYGSPGQTADLQEWRGSGGSLVAAIAPDGTVNVNGTIGAANDITSWGDVYAERFGADTQAWMKMGSAGRNGEPGVDFGPYSDTLLYRSAPNVLTLDCGYLSPPITNEGSSLQLAGYDGSGNRSTASVSAGATGWLYLNGSGGFTVFSGQDAGIPVNENGDQLTVFGALKAAPQSQFGGVCGLTINMPSGTTADFADFYDGSGDLVYAFTAHQFNVSANLSVANDVNVAGNINATSYSAGAAPGLTQTISLPGGGTLTVQGGIITGYTAP